MKRSLLLTAMFSLTLALAGCGHHDGPNNKPNGGPSVAAPPKESVLLAQEPSGAKAVKDVKKDAKDGEEVVIVGQIAAKNSKTGFIGKASFTLTDLSMHACVEEGCGDYFCEYDSKDFPQVVVKFVDAQGQTQPQDAKSWLGLQELQVVVVRATAKRDADGHLTLVATGLYPRPGSTPKIASKE